jgi:adenine-specific DNA-methyltransferase
VSTPSSPTDAAAQPTGRLELTWTNKALRLLSDDANGYAWVPPADYRVAEVRLLHQAAEVGKPQPDGGSLVIRGDALHALTSLVELPEYRRQYAGKVKLCYIDPPFNTGQAFEQYDDNLQHSVWLTMIRDRLFQIRDLLAPDGSVWVHLDDTEVHYCRVLMDEVFGRQNFISAVIWQKADTLRNDATRFSTSHDQILVFAKDAATWRTNRLPRSDEMNATYKNPDNDPRGPWLPVPLQAPGLRLNSTFVVVSPNTGKEHLPPKGKCWRRSPVEVAELIADDRIWFGRDGLGVPQLKRYLTEVGDRVPDTLWSVKDVDGNRQSKAEMTALFGSDAFATPKPEKLLQRVLQVSTGPGDLVLDCFAGSGTTAAVAQKMERRFIAVERSTDTLAGFTIPRLEKVVAGTDLGGITNDVRWAGGGGFTVLDVAPSMFDAAHGMVFLSEWATGGKLAEVTAAQLGYPFEPDGPFTGRKGRTRLAVIDGLVNADVVRVLLAQLDEDELVEVAATSVDPEAVDVLRQLRRGSRLRKIPQAILRSYQRTSRLHTLLSGQVDRRPSEEQPVDAAALTGAPSTAPVRFGGARS